MLTTPFEVWTRILPSYTFNDTSNFSSKPYTYLFGSRNLQSLLRSCPTPHYLAVQTRTPSLCFCGRHVVKLSPSQPPPPSYHLPDVKGRIAIIGLGLTGVACAAHAIAHGFDVVIYEQTCTVGACTRLTLSANTLFFGHTRGTYV